MGTFELRMTGPPMLFWATSEGLARASHPPLQLDVLKVCGTWADAQPDTQALAGVRSGGRAWREQCAGSRRAPSWPAGSGPRRQRSGGVGPGAPPSGGVCPSAPTCGEVSPRAPPSGGVGLDAPRRARELLARGSARRASGPGTRCQARSRSPALPGRVGSLSSAPPLPRPWRLQGCPSAPSSGVGPGRRVTLAELSRPTVRQRPGGPQRGGRGCELPALCGKSHSKPLKLKFPRMPKGQCSGSQATAGFQGSARG